MTVEELSKQFEALRLENQALRGQLTDISARVDRPQTPLPPAPVATVSTPETKGGFFWAGTRCESITLTQGISDDWDPRFDSTAATNVVPFDVPTAMGSLNHAYIGGATAFRRFVLTFDSPSANNVDARISGSRQDDSAAGYVQIKVNGVITEYLLDGPAAGANTEHLITIPVKEGRNRIVICTQYTPFCTQFDARLFDPTRGGAFYDPRPDQTFPR